MEFKNKIWVRFFGSKQQARDKQVPERVVQEKQQAVAVAPQPSHPQVSETELRFPQEHALNKLCDMRIQRAGGRSGPRLRLEGREDFTQTELNQELGRLRKVVTLAADSRLKEVMSREEKALEKAKANQARSQKPDEQYEEQKEESVEMDALPLIHVAADKLSAWVMVFPPVGEGRELDREQLDNALKASGVAFGVDEELLKSLPENKERYFFLYNVAKGKPACQGKDGYIIERYDRVVERKFEVDEHDRVDYTSLQFFQSVQKGDVICEAVLPTQGDPGRTVLDQEIPVKAGKAAPLTKGRNTEISEDGTKLVASKAGHVEYTGKGFQVKSVMEIAGNVDYSTGNIRYIGDVHICGSVCGGFSVQASGNITVDGVVEAGSIDAGGDLVVARGIVGNSQSVVRAKGSVYTKYLENSVVYARENLKADCIVNSEVYSDGEIEVCSGRGIIVGGRIRAAKKISAKVIGSKSESQTAIYLGGEPCVEHERHELQEIVEEYQKELEKLDKRPDSPSKTECVNQIRLDLLVKRAKLQKMEEEMEQKQIEVENEGGCRLNCDLAYPGILLTICDVKARLKQEISKCNARLVEGEIKFI